MSGVVCPKCGVAVVPGYVKCPKCQSPLPARSRAITNMGGTALGGGGGVPVIPLVVGGAVALAIVLFFALKKDSPAVAEEVTEDAQVEAEQTGSAQVRLDPTTLPDPVPQEGSAGPDPTAAISALDRALKKERLWGTVSAAGTRVDIHTGACNDPGMAPVLATATQRLKDAGLTRLRCMEQSGAVVFERDL